MAKELKPFDKILVRNSNKGYWIPAFYGFKSKDMKHHLTSAGWQDECISYEGNEEYLGTNKDYVCPEIVESEDEQHRKWILEYLYDGLRKSDEQFKDQFKCAIAWFEKQGEQKPANWLQELEDKLANATPQQIAEWKEKYFKEEPAWSEEDEKIVNLILCICSDFKKVYSQSETALKDADKIESFLESLKDRYTWKPSDEQMEALHKSLCHVGNSTAIQISKLISDFKKL